MKDIDKIKLWFVTVFTAINGALGNLAIPFYILVAANIIDYATGICAAKYRGERVQSAVGFHGIAKKVCMWLLVAVGAMTDCIVNVMTATLHIELGFANLVAIAVTLWLAANELISILENISDIGTPLPPFLVKLTQAVRDSSEIEIK